MNASAPILHVATPDDLRAIQRAAAEHAIQPLAPTHVLKRGAELVGYGSAGVARLIAGWTAPSVTDEESLTALRELENAAGQAKLLIICASEDCRFKPFLKQHGWIEGRPVTVFLKRKG